MSSHVEKSLHVNIFDSQSFVARSAAENRVQQYYIIRVRLALQRS
jgi:hypothetical protein